MAQKCQSIFRGDEVLINIAVPGVNGRMGQAVAQEVLQQNDMRLSVATVRAANILLGTKVANSDVEIKDSLRAADFNVLIDFTLPPAVLDHVAYCVAHKHAMVVGTTGLNAEQMQQITQAAQSIPIVFAANMSLGVNMCYKLLATAAKMLDTNWQINVHDLHHADKLDAPSGTAKQMRNVLQNALQQVAGKDVPAITNTSTRAGDNIGEHTVTFSSPFEQVVIAHVANDRVIYAQGAVQAARWVYNKAPGLYSMLDVLGD